MGALRITRSLLYPRRISPQKLLDGRLGGPESVKTQWQGGKSLLMSGIEQ